MRSIEPISGWNGLLIKKVATHPTGPAPPFFLAKPLLGVILRGEHDCTWRQTGNSYSRRCLPGSFTLINAPVEISKFEEHAGAEHLIVEIDPTTFAKWGGSHCSSRSFSPVVEGEDGSIASLVVAMQDEVAKGCPSEPLYGESLSVALLSYLESHYAKHRLKVIPQGLPTVKIRRIKEYVLDNLNRELSLGELAALVGLSPQHLCRSFKKAMGVTPYHYVVDARIHEAKEILLGRELSIAEAGLAVGFSSQSHFSDTFRRFTGMSPRQFRSAFTPLCRTTEPPLPG